MKVSLLAFSFLDLFAYAGIRPHNSSSLPHTAVQPDEEQCAFSVGSEMRVNRNDSCEIRAPPHLLLATPRCHKILEPEVKVIWLLCAMAVKSELQFPEFLAFPSLFGICLERNVLVL